MKTIKFYTKLYQSFIKNTFARETDYRGNMIAEIIDSLLNLAVNITFFQVLYLNVDSIGGWDSLEILMLVGVSQLITAILYTLFMNNLPRIQKYVFYGELDYILLKPCDEQFYISLRYFYFAGIPSIIFSIGLILYTTIQLNLDVQIVTIFVFIIYILCSVIICYSIWLFIMSLSILVLKVDQIHELFLSSLKFTEYPKGIYKGGIRLILLYIFPLVTVSNVPVEWYLKKIDIIHSIYIILLAVLFFVFSRKFWKFSLQKYASASA